MQEYIGTKIIKAQLAGADGYDVEYENGHRSFSPREVLEKAYRRTDAMTFGQAMEALRLGHKVRRYEWTDTTQLYMETYQSGPVRAQVMQQVLWEPRMQHYLYQPSQRDMTAEDWMIITPQNNRAMKQVGNSLKAA